MTLPKQKVFEAMLEEKEREAIQFIRDNEPPEGYAVAYSGGKDSEVTLHLVERSGVKYSVHYCNTTIDPPDILKHIKKHHPECKVLRSKKSFWQWMMYQGKKGGVKALPLRNKRWC